MRVKSECTDGISLTREIEPCVKQAGSSPFIIATCIYPIKAERIEYVMENLAATNVIGFYPSTRGKKKKKGKKTHAGKWVSKMMQK